MPLEHRFDGRKTSGRNGGHRLVNSFTSSCLAPAARHGKEAAMSMTLVSRRHMLAPGAGLAIGASTAAEETTSRPVVVELFSSQSCSACPPADEFMLELKSMAGVIALSLHVDYWDYLGWRDTLSDKAYSKRQYDYARWRGDRNVYTPQMIVNGADYFVGSHRPAVRTAIERAKAEPSTMWVPVTLSEKDRELVVTVDEARGKALKATLWLMAIMPSIAVEITRGENAGRTIVYVNVVRNIVPAGMWHGAAFNFRIPMEDLVTEGGKACVALLQAGSVGPVIGAATWQLAP